MCLHEGITTNCCSQVCIKSATKKTFEHNYLSIIQTNIDDPDILWGHCSNIYKDMIQKLHNNAARVIIGNFYYISFRGIGTGTQLGMEFPMIANISIHQALFLNI